MLNQQEESAQGDGAVQSKAESEEHSDEEEEPVQQAPIPEHVIKWRQEFENACSFDIEDDLIYCPRHLLEPHERKILEDREKKAAETEQRKSRFGDVLNVINAPPAYPDSDHSRHRSKNSSSPNPSGSPGFQAHAVSPHFL